MKIERVATGPDVGITNDRMIEIIHLIGPTARDKPQVEYSAVLGAGAVLMAVSFGMLPSHENCSRILAKLIEKLAPIMEEELKKRG